MVRRFDRDLRIDLFRGLALWWISLDHSPETYLNHFTPKNFGFSDAAEILVFLSGLASGSVYGGVATLPMCCASVLLSFAAHAILRMGWNGLTSQTLVSTGGIASMAAISALLARSDRAADVHPRTL